MSAITLRRQTDVNYFWNGLIGSKNVKMSMILYKVLPKCSHYQQQQQNVLGCNSGSCKTYFKNRFKKL